MSWTYLQYSSSKVFVNILVTDNGNLPPKGHRYNSLLSYILGVTFILRINCNSSITE
nr:hypothetical protein Iba_chr14aCG23560 [Ipomoea batatas]GME07935.1 hypothetical protein Iba_scaffold7103CG0540 [Ipomoea batatas]GME19252.1 hypothetical protein Iba_scaffold22284CG0010 [Ipomoea batatas]